jgi:hypothetical protein
MLLHLYVLIGFFLYLGGLFLKFIRILCSVLLSAICKGYIIVYYLFYFVIICFTLVYSLYSRMQH